MRNVGIRHWLCLCRGYPGRPVRRFFCRFYEENRNKTGWDFVLCGGCRFLCCFGLHRERDAFRWRGSDAAFSNCLFQPFQIELQNKQVTTINRATALSINAMIIDSVGAGTSLVFGSLAEASLKSAFLFGAGLCMLGLILFLLWRRSQDKERVFHLL